MINEKLHKLILCFIPTNICNLKCKYCFVSHTNEWTRDDIEFKYPVDHIVKALSEERLGGKCLINLTAQGETLLYKDIVPLTRGILEQGHYVEIVTNATITKRIDEILAFPPEILSRIEFKCSYHYEQLKNLKIEQRFWDNIRKIKKSVASFSVEIMPNDEISAELPTICSHCKENVGANCHATVGRNDRIGGKSLLTDGTEQEYRQTWDVLKSDMFNFKMSLLNVRRKEFCYAGAWSLLVDISSGEATQCYGRMNTQNIFHDLTKKIKFVPVGYTCTQPYCFNGHAHLSLGVIPELNSTNYFQIRNRYDEYGNPWIKEPCAAFFKQKLADNNRGLSSVQKFINTIVNPFFLTKSLFHDIHGVKRKVKKYIRVVRGKYSGEKK